MEWDLKNGVHVDGYAVVHGWLEFPFGKRLARATVQAFIKAAHHFHRVHMAIFSDDRG